MLHLSNAYTHLFPKPNPYHSDGTLREEEEINDFLKNRTILWKSCVFFCEQIFKKGIVFYILTPYGFTIQTF